MARDADALYERRLREHQQTRKVVFLGALGMVLALCSIALVIIKHLAA